MGSRGSTPPGRPEVTVRGAPGGPGRASPGQRRPALPALLLGLAALTVVAGVVLGQREAEPPAQPPVDGGELVLGTALPLTGVLAPYGSAQRRGVQRVLDEVEADGGLAVAGVRRPVRLLVRDTRSLPDVAGQEALVLVRGPYELLGLLGPCAPPVAVVRVAESRRVPLVTGCQPLPAIGSGPLRHTWELAPGEPARAAAVFASLRVPRAGRVGLFLSNDRPEQPWTSAAARAGVRLAGTYRPQGSDWSPALDRAAADGVQLVVAVTQPPEGVALWQGLRRRGLPTAGAYASEAGLGSAWYDAVGRSGDGTLTDLVHPAASGAAPQQVDDAVAAVSAELTRVLLAGLQRAGAPERPDLQTGLAGTRGRVAGAAVRLGDQTARPPVRLARWVQGRLQPVGP